MREYMGGRLFGIDAPLFDAATAIVQREAGMALAATARPTLLAEARRIAMQIALQRGTVTADDVAARMVANGMDYAALGNASGSVFRGPFVWTGEVVTSHRVSTHARAIKVWRLKQGGAA
jgi:hypothetical protein